MSFPWSSISELLGARERRGWVCNGREGPCEISLVLFSGCGASQREPNLSKMLQVAGMCPGDSCWVLQSAWRASAGIGMATAGSTTPEVQSSEAWPPTSLKTELPHSIVSFWRRHFCSHPCLGGARANQILVCSYESCR